MMQRYTFLYILFSMSSTRILAFTTPRSRQLYLNRILPRNRSRSAHPLSTQLNAIPSQTHVPSLKDIDWVRHCVAQALNKAFDPVAVSKQRALAKLKNADKKKKGDGNDSIMAPPEDIVVEGLTDSTTFNNADAMVTVATKLEFGDYQCNAAMTLAKSVSMNPRDCSAKIVDCLRPYIQDVMEEPDIAGPGFINLRFKKEYLAESIENMARDSDGRLAIPLASMKKKIIVDYSSPNIAKEMHVGHLRSTIIGHTLANVLEFAGHEVIRLNHIGDWGTQFGMLVEHLRDEYPAALRKETSGNVELGDLVMLYKAAKKRFDADDDFKARARKGVVALQAGDPEAIAAWESLCAASRVEYQKIYDLLNINKLVERGESFYNPFLQDVVDDLEKRELAVESDGATAVFLEGYSNRDGTSLPLIVRKSDGGFNYATTDLAAIRHRTELADGEKADRVLYVTDAGQAQHFDMVFAAAKKAGFVRQGVSLEHVPFGLVQGEDGKKFATRSGDTVKLKDLLNEAIRIAGDDMKARRQDQSEIEGSKVIDDTIKAVGIGAVKYADLSMNRESNYRFSYERMLSLNGNTAPYMLYSYARICGIVRKATEQQQAENNMVWPMPAQIVITDSSELTLIRNLVKLPDVLADVEANLYPNKLCDYLFETSQMFNKFYESCSVNNAETSELKASRLTLCTVTAATIKLSMNLLGIQVVERL